MSAPDIAMPPDRGGFRALSIRISDRIDKLVMRICAVLLVLMTIDLLVGVFYRYVLFNPFIWTEELSRYMMVWVAGLAMSSGIKREEHLTISFLVDKFPRGLALAIDLVLRVLLAGFLFILTYYGVFQVMDNIPFTSQALNITMAIPVSVVPVSGALMLIQLFFVTYLRLSDRSIKSE